MAQAKAVWEHKRWPLVHVVSGNLIVKLQEGMPPSPHWLAVVSQGK